jgi:hypothetical protein
MRDLEARGLKPMWHKSVSILSIEVDVTARSMPQLGPLRPVSYTPQTIIEGDTELTFVTYDNGDPETWEGLVYVRTPYDESTYMALVSTPGFDYSYWDVVWEVYYPSDGSDPQCASGPCPILSQHKSWPDYAPSFAQRPKITQAAYLTSSAKPAHIGLFGWFKKWWRNSCGNVGKVPCIALGCVRGRHSYKIKD